MEKVDVLLNEEYKGVRFRVLATTDSKHTIFLPMTTSSWLTCGYIEWMRMSQV